MQSHISRGGEMFTFISRVGYYVYSSCLRF